MIESSLIHVLNYFFLLKRPVPIASAYEYSLIIYEYLILGGRNNRDLSRVHVTASCDQRS